MSLSKPFPIPCSPGQYVYLPCCTSVHPLVPDSCVKYSAHIGKEAFIAAVRMYGILYTLSALGRRKGLSLKILVPSVTRSAAFLGVFASAYAAGNCIGVRTSGGNYPRNYFISAFVAAFASILVEHPNRRGELMLYTANVAAESLFNMAVNRGMIKPIANGAILIFAISWAVLLYLNQQSPADLDNAAGIVDTIHGRRAAPDSWDLKLARAWLKYTGRAGDAATLLRDSDVAYSGFGFVRGMLLGSALKGGLSLAGVILNPSRLVKPWWWKLHVSGALRFGAMVSLMSGGARSIAAATKRLRGGVDDGLNEGLGGLIAGSSFALSGNKEVAMYMLAKAGSGAVSHMFRRSGMPKPQHGAEFLYALNTAIIFYQSAFEQHNLRPSYWKFLIKITNGHIVCFRQWAVEWRKELGIPGPLALGAA